VRQVAEERGLENDTIERMEAEAVERMENTDLFPIYPAPGNIPFDKIVARICEDLGLEPPPHTSPPPAELAGGGPQGDHGLEPGEHPAMEGAGGSNDAYGSVLRSPDPHDRA